MLTVVFQGSVLLVFIISAPFLGSTGETTQAPENSKNDSLSITNYGAIANDGKDDLKAIQAAIDDAVKQNKSVKIPPGEFHYSAIIRLAGVRMFGQGAGSSVLLGMNPNETTILMTGKGPSIESLKIVSVHGHTVKRSSGPYGCGVFIGALDGVTRTTDFLVKQVTVVNVSGAGIMGFGSGPGKILLSQVHGSLSDCVHLTYGAHDVIVADNSVSQCGDDMYATVSYANEKNVVKNILIQNNSGHGGKARGCSAVGSRDVTFVGNRISKLDAAGVYVAAETSWKTKAPTNILVLDNHLEQVAEDPVVNHSGLLVSTDFGLIFRVAFLNNTVRRTRGDGVRVGGDTKNTRIVGNQLFTVKGIPIKFSKDQNKDVYADKNFLNGKKLQTQGKPVKGSATGSSLRYNSKQGK